MGSQYLKFIRKSIVRNRFKFRIFEDHSDSQKYVPFTAILFPYDDSKRNIFLRNALSGLGRNRGLSGGDFRFQLSR